MGSITLNFNQISWGQDMEVKKNGGSRENNNKEDKRIV